MKNWLNLEWQALQIVVWVTSHYTLHPFLLLWHLTPISPLIFLQDPQNAKFILENDGMPMIISCLSKVNLETVLSAITTLYYMLNAQTKTSTLHPITIWNLKKEHTHTTQHTLPSLSLSLSLFHTHFSSPLSLSLSLSLSLTHTHTLLYLSSLLLYSLRSVCAHLHMRNSHLLSSSLKAFDKPVPLSVSLSSSLFLSLSLSHTHTHTHTLSSLSLSLSHTPLSHTHTLSSLSLIWPQGQKGVHAYVPPRTLGVTAHAAASTRKGFTAKEQSELPLMGMLILHQNYSLAKWGTKAECWTLFCP